MTGGAHMHKRAIKSTHRHPGYANKAKKLRFKYEISISGCLLLFVPVLCSEFCFKSLWEILLPPLNKAFPYYGCSQLSGHMGACASMMDTSRVWEASLASALRCVLKYRCCSAFTKTRLKSYNFSWESMLGFTYKAKKSITKTLSVKRAVLWAGNWALSLQNIHQSQSLPTWALNIIAETQTFFGQISYFCFAHLNKIYAGYSSELGEILQTYCQNMLLNPCIMNGG